MSKCYLVAALSIAIAAAAPAHAQLYEHVQTLYDELANPKIIRMSNDERNLYVLVENALLVYELDETSGAPDLIQTLRFGDGLGETIIDTEYFVLSNDDRFVYLSDANRYSITALSRSPLDGILERVQQKVAKYPNDFTVPSYWLEPTPDSSTLIQYGQIYTLTSGVLSEFLGSIHTYSVDASSGHLALAKSYQAGDGTIPEGVTFDVARVSPDGRHLYAADRLDNRIHIFAIDSSNHMLTYQSAFLVPNPQSGGLTRAQWLEFSPDSRFLYAAYTIGDNPHVYARNTVSGELTLLQRNAISPAPPETQPMLGSSITLSADASLLYMQIGGDGVAIFSRDSNTGLLTLTEIYASESQENFSSTQIEGMVATAKRLYTIDGITDGIQTFVRTPVAGSLSLTDIYRGLDGPSSPQQLIPSPDGRFLYSNTERDGAFVTLNRNPADGMLAVADVIRENFDTDLNTNIVIEPLSNTGFGTFDNVLRFDSETGIPMISQSPLLEDSRYSIAPQSQVLFSSISPNILTAQTIDIGGHLLLPKRELALPPPVSYIGLIAASSRGQIIYLTDFSSPIIHIVFTIGGDLVQGAYFRNASVPGLSGDEARFQFTNLTVSPDERQVYVTDAANHSVYIFQHETDALSPLSHIQTLGGSTKHSSGELREPYDALPTRDGKYLVVADGGLQAILVYERDQATGLFEYVEISARDGNLEARATYPPTVAESMDGLYLYTSATAEDGIAVFERRVQSAITGRAISITEMAPLGASIISPVVALTESGGDSPNIATGDANGRYSFSDLEEGTYSGRVMAAGYEDVELSDIQFAGDNIELGRTFMQPLTTNTVLMGTVSSADSGLPIPGLAVSAQSTKGNPLETYTAADGSYEFAFADGLTGDNIALSILDNEFAEFNDATSLGPNEATRFDVVVEPIADPGAGKLSGTVNSGDDPVSFPQLTFIGPMRLTTEGDVSGNYAVSGLESGIYTVRVSAVGFAGRSHYVNILEEKAYTRDFNLLPGGFADPSEDGVVNSVDIQSVINAVLAGAGSGSSGNVNGDDAVNAIDIQTIINTVLQGN